jgi:hypothetical protein
MLPELSVMVGFLASGRTTLGKEAQVLLEKWQNRGPRPDVRSVIRTNVSSVPAPAP